MKKNVTILGSTGSIGVNTLKVLANLKEEYCIFALSAKGNVEKLVSQCEDFSPSMVAIRDKEKYPKLKERLAGTGIKLSSGLEGLKEIVEDERVHTVVVAMSGCEGIFPILDAIKKGKRIAIANKESIVMAGRIIIEKVRKFKVDFIPIDSEHNAIFQCLKGEDINEIKNLILTASGGPFVNLPPDKLINITPEQAVAHPRWNMGKKISVDSATLMNKALEIVEATYLFNTSNESIKVLIHPEAIIHSMIEFVDGNIIALLSPSDMRMAIQYALTHPNRLQCNINKLDFDQLKCFTFIPPDFKKFPALKLGYKAAEDKGTLPAVMNAANEVAVNSFLNRQLKYNLIVPVVEKVMSKHDKIESPDIEQIIEADKWAREKAREVISKY